MMIQLLFVVIFFTQSLVAQAAGARAPQDEQRPSTAAAEDALAQCAQVQPVVQQLLQNASTRLEAARQTNSPTELRAAADDLDAALRDLRTQLVPCSIVDAVDPHAGHSMPEVERAPGGVDLHSGHTMPAANSAQSEAQKIEEWLKGYDTAFNAKDLDRLATFYHPDVTIFEGAGVNNGWVDYRDRHLGPELESFENLEFGHTNRRVHMLGDDAAYVVSDYFIKAKMGDRTLDNIGRETLVLERQADGGWKIRHSHTSGRARPQK